MAAQLHHGLDLARIVGELVPTARHAARQHRGAYLVVFRRPHELLLYAVEKKTERRVCARQALGGWARAVLQALKQVAGQIAFRTPVEPAANRADIDASVLAA